MPDDVIDPTGLIARSCPADRGNSFTITGRGGLPINPTELLSGQMFWHDWRLQSQSLQVGERERSTAGESTKSNQFLITNSQLPMIAVTGWQINRKGQVELVANAQGMISNAWTNKSTCGVQ